MSLISAVLGRPALSISTTSVTMTSWFLAPPGTNQHCLTLSITPCASEAVTLSARFGAAAAWRVISFGGFGCCSGVLVFWVVSLFLRMSSISESTGCLVGGAGLGGAGFGGSTFFTSGLGGSGLGGSGCFSTLGGSCSLGFKATTSSGGLGGSGLGCSMGLGGTGFSSATSGLGGSGAGGGSAVLGGGALVVSLSILASLGCGGGLPTVGAAACLSIATKSTITGSGSIGGRLKKLK